MQRFDASEREGEKLQHVLIGSPEGIFEATHTLHALRYVEVELWSPVPSAHARVPVPMPGTSLSMSVLTRYRSRS